MKKFILALALFAAAFSSADVSAQVNDRERQNHSQAAHSRFALSTNIVDYIYCVTPNLDLQVSLAARVTLEAGAKYNNWSFNYGTANEVKNRQQTYYVGARWWPWYSYSGWYVGGAAQYQEYDNGGIFRSDAEAGTAIGIVARGGYALHVTKWLNIDFGLSFWGGNTNYTLYECPYCGKKLEEGHKWFILPNEARIALQFVF